ncbi:unnamed protein product [Adineta steineri]|uniref:UDP-N-acetylglucosamine--peptide N-acetylglucosaminyltransferase SPINDLY n=2 Tax=Adineta steineri TaxID=433720 RepID=A0A818GSG1_9BILA|nr:unnamed protein product [Adineta steineri]
MATSKSNGTITIEPTSGLSTNATGNRCMNMQRMQNVLLIWLDNNITDDNTDCSNAIKQLKRVVNNMYTFTDGEQCLEFIQTITNNKICMIVSGLLGKHIVPHVHGMSQVDTIFIFCDNRKWHEQWTNEWPKIKGVYTDITSVCEALKQAADQCEQNAISISFVASNKKLDQLDPLFIYTQILKEIISTINFEDKHFEEFITFCREVFANDENELKHVNQLQLTYKNHIPIWWYTWDAFLYRMLNQAFKSMDINIIIRMSFFINDLHRDIQRIHSQQSDDHSLGKTFTVYRGEGLSKADFIEMRKTKGGLLSFNNFLLTNKNPSTALEFIQQAATNPDLVGVLFVMSINSSDVSYFHEEDEVLFSMHTIFRIEDIRPMDENDHLYQVSLTLTDDKDQDRRTLSDHIRQETFPDVEGWRRLGQLLIKMGQFNKAQEVYEVLLDQTTYESEKASIYHQLGEIKYDQEEYQEALAYYKQSLAIQQKTLPFNHLNLASSYNNIGSVYYSTGDYLNALSSYEKAFAIKQESLPSNHSDLGDSYDSIGSVYYKMGDYPKALSSYEKAITIRQESLSSNHPDLASSYNNIGLMYYNMGDYLKALSSHEKALVIKQKSLPPNHPDLGGSYNNIGLVYDSMGDYSKALFYYKKDLEILQQILPSNHPDLGSFYNNIGIVYRKMGDYSKALSSYEKALAIKQQSFPSSHPDLASSYNNIGLVYYNMDDYPKALFYYEKDLAIRQQSLSSNHPDLGASYNNIGLVYDSMNDYAKALSYYEKDLEILQQSLPSNHPDLGGSYNNIGNVHYKIGDYQKALSSHEKALAIKEQSLPPNHPDLSASYNNIGSVYENMGNYLKAHSFYERAIQNGQQSLPTNHPTLQQRRRNLENIKKKF